MLRIKSKRILYKNGLFDGYVYLDGDKIAEITADEKAAEECYDVGEQYLSPGFIDTHTHGGNGKDFYNSTPEDVADACNFHLLHGMTTILPTVAACPYQEIERSVQNLALALERGLIQANVPGAHIEGPYLSKKQCGAQSASFITPPVKEEYERLIGLYGAYIKRWTYAPENDEKGEFCRYITANGILASAGHTDARYEDMLVAIENGCNLITHLYSCTSTVTREGGFRHLGVIESAFLCDALNVELIADGKHLPPALIQMILKIKGTDKVILTTDSLSVAGSGVTEGVLAATPFIIEDGVAKLPDRTAFAGSIATADTLVRTLTQSCGISLCESVKMLTKNPARLLGLNKGEIAVGKDADLIAFDEDVNVSAVFVMGKKI